MTTSSNQARNTRELVIERVFDAPRELVWQAWTDPERMKLWWGPTGFTAPSCQIDLRVGGKYLNCMRDEQGNEFWSTGTYLEIVEPERLVTTDSFADPDGNVVHASHYGMPDDLPMEFQITLTFEDIGGRTKLTLRHAGLPEKDIGAEEGWNQSLDKLAATLVRP